MAAAVLKAAREVAGDAGRELLRSRAWVWFLPVAVFYAVRSQPQDLVLLAAGAPVAVAIVVLVARQPVRGFCLIVAVLPFHTWILSFLYRLGVPREFVRPAAYWKELVAAGIVLAALRKARDEGHRADWLDWAAFIYLAVIAVYFLFPRLMVPATLEYPLGAPTERTIRLLAARSDAFFVILLLALRHLRLGSAPLEKIARITVRTALVVAAIGVVEFVATSLFDRVFLDVLQLPAYLNNVLGVPTYAGGVIHQYATVAGTDFLRVGSVLGSPLALGFMLILPFAVAIERLTRRADPATIARVALIGAAIILTQTRSAALAAVVVGLMAARKLRGRRQSARVHFLLAGAALLIIAIPFASSTGLAGRFSAASEGTDESTSLHWESTYAGLRVLIGQPWGRGIGTAPGVGDRFALEGALTSENYYIQVGTEMGVIGIASFIVLVVTVGRRAARAARHGSESTLPAASWGAFLGLCIGALLLHVFADLSTAWVAWGAVGAAIGSAEAGPPAGSRGPADYYHRLVPT